MNETIFVTLVVVAAFAAVFFYREWIRRRDREHWKRQTQHQDLVLSIRRELRSHEAALVARCNRLQRRLAQQQRTLRYVARRLS